MAVLGMETSSGDFEVIDLCFAGLPDIYTPKASTSANGKGKAKAETTEMGLDGTSSLLRENTADESSERVGQNLGRDGFGIIDGGAGSSSGSEGRNDGRMAYWRSWRFGGMPFLLE
jgi:hypothetical protein